MKKVLYDLKPVREKMSLALEPGEDAKSTSLTAAAKNAVKGELSFSG